MLICVPLSYQIVYKVGICYLFMMVILLYYYNNTYEQTRIGLLQTRIGLLQTRIGLLQTRIGLLQTRIGLLQEDKVRFSYIHHLFNPLLAVVILNTN